MKEKIYTIPINDAFDSGSECAICEFEKSEEKAQIEYVLGASMMEPDARIFTNLKGFCSRHASMLLSAENKLSLALVLKTHIDDLLETFDGAYADVCGLKDVKTGIFSKRRSTDSDTLENIEKNISERADSCAVCEKLDSVMNNFTENLLYLYEKDGAFREKFLSSKGFCLKHCKLLVKKSRECLKGKTLVDFLVNLTELEKDNFSRISEELDWFTKKFDYRYEKEGWKNSRDSVQRGALKAAGFIDNE